MGVQLDPQTNLTQRFHEYCRELPVIGFNSAKYDVCSLRATLLPLLDPKFIIKGTGNNYKAITTSHFQFLDLCNYLPPGTSYAKFLKAYDVEEAKGHFCYEFLDSYEKLNYPQLPAIEHFHSTLKGPISPTDYAECQKIWRNHNMTQLADYLEYYNKKDVEPFLVGIDKLWNFYKELGVDMFKEGISVPGIAMRLEFKDLQNTFFALFKEEITHLFRNNIVGGPSLLFHRHHKAGSTYIRQGQKLCQSIIGFDANALYLYAIMQEMPAGYYIRRQAPHFKKEYSTKAARKSLEWLQWLQHTLQHPLQHKFNSSTEKRIGKYPVDGFDPETQIIYQFHGCYWHGHTCMSYKNPVNAAVAQKRTEETTAYLRDRGYKVVEMWECAWDTMKKQDPEISAYVKSSYYPFEHKMTVTTDDIMKSIQDGSFYGFVECDIHVPDDLKEKFAEMPPIFKNTELSPSDGGEYMAEFARVNGLNMKPRRCLIGSMFGEKILLVTLLLKWYLDHGLVVTRIYQTLQFKPEKCFESFGNTVTENRRAGDVDPAKKMIGDSWKLLGNCAYGKTATDKTKHRDVIICRDDTIDTHINSGQYRSLNILSDTHYEVTKSKKIIRLDLPLQIAMVVYQIAKLRMLEFKYELVDKYIDHSDYQYNAMDTDSAYLALSTLTFEEAIKPHMLEEYHREKHLWFPREDHHMYDMRTPGLFKIEWQGTEFLGLCSKTYYCSGSQDKFAAKGVSRKNVTMDVYRQVLATKQTATGVNRGMRMKGNKMYSYTQEKDAFTYLYFKRRVLADGVSTTYLDK